jgi:hypothetical protein
MANVNTANFLKNHEGAWGEGGDDLHSSPQIFPETLEQQPPQNSLCQNGDRLKVPF